MTWNYVYNPNILSSLLAVLLMTVLFVYSWNRRSVPAARLFSIGSLFTALWIAGFILEQAAVGVDTKIFWLKVQAAWMLIAVTTNTCFVLEYTWPGRWLTRRNLLLLSIMPLLTVGMVLTDDLYHLMWTGFRFDGSVIPLRSSLQWFLFAYGYGLSLVEILAFAWLFMRSPQHRWPVAFMISGKILSRLIYLLGVTEIVGFIVPVNVMGIVIQFLTYAIALYGFRIFDPIPLARQMAIKQLDAGMLVLDPQDRIAGLNPAAEHIFGVPASHARGRPVREVLPACLAVSLNAREKAVIEFSLGESRAVRDYTLAISPVRDWREIEVGRLLLFRDVTEPKRARELEKKQEMILTILQERERMARELHDSLGQVLGYVSLQAQAVSKNLHAGETAVAEAQLARLVSVAQDAHADLRETILSLRSGAPLKSSLLSALEQHLAAYQVHYGICTELILAPDLAEEDFAPEVGVQLLRAIQEALTNAHRHAKAQKVRVTLTRQGNQASIVVADDGRGFDQQALPASGEEHFGLGFMRERMAQIGGSLTVCSAVGSGTQVKLQVPIRTLVEETE